MSRYIAIEWENREARVLVANLRGKSLVLEQAFQVPWEVGSDGRPVEGSLPAQLSAALAPRGLRRLDCLVAVSRNSVELKSLQLPPAPDDELPELVRWQAQREFHSLGDAWPLDYVPLSATPGEPRTVLAAAISPDLARQITTTCEGSQLRVERMVLRSGAAASCFLRGKQRSSEPVRLLVDLLADEVELVALVDRDVVFVRTARLRGDVHGSDDAFRGLMAEIRRTLAALSNQLSGRRVEALYLYGTAATHQPLAERIAAELSLATHVFDPWEVAEVDPALRRQMPADAGRFAALVGMLADEAEEIRPAIDFLHPRRPPPPPSKRRTYALAATLAALLVVSIVGSIGWQLYRLDRRIAELQRELLATEPLAKASAEQLKAADAVEAWLASDVTWLDELYQLNQRLPGAQDAMLSQLRLAADAAGGGSIQFDGYVREPATVDQLETALRSPRHRVDGQGRQQATKDRYAWQFKTTVAVAPPGATPAAPPPAAANDQASAATAARAE